MAFRRKTRRASRKRTVVAAAGLVLAVVGGFVASRAEGSFVAASKPSPGAIDRITASLTKAITEEDDARTSIGHGEKGGALLALGSARHALEQALALDGGYQDGSEELASSMADALVRDDDLIETIGAAGVGPTTRANSEYVLGITTHEKQDALRVFGNLGGSAAGQTTAPSESEPPESCVDVLRGATGEHAFFAVEDPQDPHDPAALTFTTPGGFDHTISVTLDSNGLKAGSLAVPPATEVEVQVKVTASPTSPPETATLAAKEDGKQHCSRPGPAASSPSTLTASTPGSTAATPAGEVIIAHHLLGWNATQTPDICKGGTLELTLTLDGIPASTEVRLKLTGSGLPSSLTLTLDPGFEVSRDFTVPASKGAVTWVSQVVSIGGKPPPTSGAHVAAFAQCPTS